jgi:hypothetical protein
MCMMVKQLTGSVGGGNNPFAAPNNQMTQYAEMAPTSFKGTFLGVEINFASEADFLKAQMAYEKKKKAIGLPSVDSDDEGGSFGGEGLAIAGQAIKTVGAFLAGRNLADKVEEIQDALDAQNTARQELAQLVNDTTFARLMPALLRYLDAERDATEAAQSALEDQILAEDMRVGGGVAQLVQQFSKRGGSMGSNFGSTAAVGLGGLGLGMMFSRGRDRDRKR